MASSKPLAVLLLVVVALCATAMTAAGQGSCNGHKVTVQNLCGHDLTLGIEARSNSKALFPNGYLLPSGKHESFDVCAWTGSVSAQGAAVAEFHMDHEGGAYYEVSTDQASMPVRVSVTPHGSPLQGHCPTAGCDTGNHCFEHSVAGGNCHGVTEIKIVYYNP
ncbi:uncharacterized protein LOC119326636 [Triticum dicoccoides]|uniref:uncharacterized protein LOC119326636 n=1 Tax=Triticum dicoccoides TaxID=85692 RepID=UPI00162EF83E|nr:uncharacterized protein LOC119326636 [Triticum dicoccoides]